MKKHILTILFIAALFFSCNKRIDCCFIGETIPTETELLDRSFKYFDDVNWTGGTAMDTIKKDSVTLYSKWHYYDLRLKFRFPADSITSSSYRITKFTATLIKHTPLGTKPDQIFTPDSLAFNRIDINHYPNKTYLSARFTLTFKLHTPTGNVATDTLKARFPDGSFAVMLGK